MTRTQDEGFRSPWATLWLSPRETITHILATRPRHLVWLLAMLGSIAGIYGQMVGAGAAGLLGDWRFWLGFVLFGAIVGIVWLYVSALILNWVGRLLGGRASALELRAVVAWSAVPVILGFIVLLLISVTARASGTAAMRGVLALVVLGFGLWSVVVFLLMLARVQHFGFWRTIATYVLNLIFPLAIAVLIRSLLYQPFNVPSVAMAPTLLNGDYFFASKFAYGYTHYSLPFSPPWFSGRIFASEPARGDVVVFRLPKDVATDYVKRVVGLPGDRIQMKQGLLYINEEPVQREPLSAYFGADLCGPGGTHALKHWRETLPNGVSYETLDCIDNGFYDNTNVYSVPPGHFFMLGDNRDNSTDSRVLSAVGYVPLENMIGRVGLIFFSRVPGSNGAASGVRTERIGMVVR
jgi:signal peptidase I